MSDRRTGTWVVTAAGVEPVRAFVPAPLPPDPPLAPSPEDLDLLDRANLALGRLAGMSSILTESSSLAAMYLRKEAVFSFRIDGARSSVADLLAHEIGEATRVPPAEILGIRNLAHATCHGRDRLRHGEPLSLALLREIHAILLERGPAYAEPPGEFRVSQSWIGGTRPGNARYIPPPPGRLPVCMEAFERFLQDPPERKHLLVKVAMAHAQLENIHPFADGNGRLGRLLIPLMLCADGVLSEPVLYLSRYFQVHRAEYHDRLSRVRTDGEWEAWIRFFLEAVLATSVHAMDTARAMLSRFEADRRALQGLGRPAASALLVHQALQAHPVLTTQKAAENTYLSLPTVTTCFDRMMDLGIVREITGRRWGRLYAYDPYLALLSEGTDPGGLPRRDASDS